MSAFRSVLAAFFLMPSWASAQTFDWSEQLQKSPDSLQAALGTSVPCSTSGYSVPVTFVDKDTTIEADLFEPVTNTSPKEALVSVGEIDLSFDRDDERRYIADGISTLVCTIGREATATAYAFNAKLFRIQLTFDRCKSREVRKRTFLGATESPFTYLSCDGVDAEEKDFDITLFQTIKARNSYGYNKQGQPGLLDFGWDQFNSDHEPAERRILFDLRCNIPSDANRRIPQDNMSYRCIIDVDNDDPTHWTATAMYEFFTPGIIYNNVKKHLTANRLFIDMTAQRQVIESMRPGLQAVVDGIKKEISDQLAAKESQDNSVSNILGAPK